MVNIKEIQKEAALAAGRSALIKGFGFIYDLWGPAAMTTLVAVLGLLRDIPLAQIITMCCVVFAAVTLGMIGAFYWRNATTAQDKLHWAGVALGKLYGVRKVTKFSKGKKGLIGLKYGIEHRNTAMFPIQYEVLPTKVSLGASFNPRPERPVKGMTSKGGAGGVFWESEVPVTEDMRGQLVEGCYEVKIKYGVKGNMIFEEVKKYKVHIKFGADGDVENHETQDVSEVEETPA